MTALYARLFAGAPISVAMAAGRALLAQTPSGFVYLAIVVDAFTREVVGWAMAEHLRTELVLDAVGMAITSRQARGYLAPASAS